MPVVKFFASLDLERIILFVDGHYPTVPIAESKTRRMPVGIGIAVNTAIRLYGEMCRHTAQTPLLPRGAGSHDIRLFRR